MIDSTMRIVLTALVPFGIMLLLLGIPAGAISTLIFQTVMNMVFGS